MEDELVNIFSQKTLQNICLPYFYSVHLLYTPCYSSMQKFAALTSSIPVPTFHSTFVAVLQIKTSIMAYWLNY